MLRDRSYECCEVATTTIHAANILTSFFIRGCQIKSWLKLWTVDAEKSRKLYRLLHDSLKDDKQRLVVHSSVIMAPVLNRDDRSCILYLLDY